MQLNLFLITGTSPLRDALRSIDANHHGVIFVTDLDGVVIASATDGDIRRHLLAGGTLDDAVKDCSNTNFVSGEPDTPRELLLKKLDHRIRVIPILDVSQHMVDLITRENLPLPGEGAIFARARAPVRISFGGGGSDLTHYFSGNGGGAVINTTISLFSHATLRIRNDQRIIIRSLDLGESLDAADLQSALAVSGRFRLVQAVLRSINPDFGFELLLHSDFPMNSGLGGSAVVSACILGCFNEFRRDKWDQHELAEIAYQAERHYLDVAGGWQDQYATVFGGFNFIEFSMKQNVVHPLRIKRETRLELEECLVLCDTNIPHDSGDIHQDQRQQMSEGFVRELVETNVKLCYSMRNNLLRGQLAQFGQTLDQAWHLKRQFSSKISSSRLDQIYEDAKEHGAAGGKLLGAGGGGFFLFYVPHNRKHELITHLKNSGLKISLFSFEELGLQSWTVRESENNGNSGIL